MELEAYSPYKRSIMKNAKVEFPDEHNMRVTVSVRSMTRKQWMIFYGSGRVFMSVVAFR